MNTFTAVIGFTAAACTTACWLPQLVRAVRTRSAFDFSWGYLSLFGGCIACWLVYGLLRADAALATANLVTLVLCLGVVALKWRVEGVAVRLLARRTSWLARMSRRRDIPGRERVR